MDTLLSVFPSDSTPLTVLGDFNLPSDKLQSSGLLALLHSFSLSFNSCPPTHKGGNVLDLTISPDLLPFITTVINGSITSGHVPTAFKKARVIPILKKPALDPSDISNYRYHGFCSDLSVSGLYISSWMMAHQLKLNPSKTELLVIP
ncbi:hypothetical protein QTP70_015938, partial [Hemibagrus guttatus]